MDENGRAENFAGAILGVVREQHPDIIVTEPHPYYFGFRRAGHEAIVNMVIGVGANTVRLSFIGPTYSETPPSDEFPYTMQSVSEIAISVIEWLDFQRHRKRGL